MKREYRIIKKWRRRNEDKANEHWFEVQMFVKGFFGPYWRVVTEWVDDSGGGHNRNLRFNTLQEAEKVMENIQQPTPADTIVYPHATDVHHI